MARKLKRVYHNGIDKRDVGYYSTPSFVADYIGKEMIRLNPSGVKVLDPAVGKGELVGAFIDAGKTLYGYDIIDYPGRSAAIDFHHENFIDRFINDVESLKDKGYDYIILNPPFNCHEHSYISKNRSTLKENFETGIFNMSAIFLEAVIRIAKKGCLIGAVLPDSFLFNISYQKLRGMLVNECTILQIILCPVDIFHHQGANVNTCILLIRKGYSNNNIIRISNRPSDIGSFKSILKNRKLQEVEFEKLYLNIDERHGIFAFDIHREIIDLFINNPHLGDLYKCGGGISTGNDGKYTSKEPGNGYTVPFYTNVLTRFIASPKAFLTDDYQEQSKGIRNFIIRNKEYRTNEGIVCSGIGKHFYAAYLPEIGVNGVNATIWPDRKDLHWLLSYLNSSLVTYLLKGIIARCNITTIGNVASLPLIRFDESEKIYLSDISHAVINGILTSKEAVAQIDKIIYRRLSLPIYLQQKIAHFYSDIAHLV